MLQRTQRQRSCRKETRRHGDHHTSRFLKRFSKVIQRNCGLGCWMLLRWTANKLRQFWSNAFCVFLRRISNLDTFKSEGFPAKIPPFFLVKFQQTYLHTRRRTPASPWMVLKSFPIWQLQGRWLGSDTTTWSQLPLPPASWAVGFELRLTNCFSLTWLPYIFAGNKIKNCFPPTCHLNIPQLCCWQQHGPKNHSKFENCGLPKMLQVMNFKIVSVTFATEKIPTSIVCL